MLSFIAKIETEENGLLEFYFASLETVHSRKYFVTTIDKKAKSHVFYLKKVDGLWRIDTSVYKVQKWILDLEYKLALLLQEKG